MDACHRELFRYGQVFSQTTAGFRRKHSRQTGHICEGRADPRAFGRVIIIRQASVRQAKFLLAAPARSYLFLPTSGIGPAAFAFAIVRGIA